MSNQQWYLISRRKINGHIFCMPCSVPMRNYISTAIAVVAMKANSIRYNCCISTAAHELCLSQSCCSPHGQGSSTNFDCASDADDNSDDVPT